MKSQTEFVSGASMTTLVQLMAQLRGPGGCPWDREQTHQSLRPFLLEESYEVLEALVSGKSEKFCEELGDLLLQIVFHAQLAAEKGQFDIDEVIKSISEKLIRRHPHVFADTKVDGVAGVLANWEQIKLSEIPGERESVLDGVPPDFPALLKAEKLQSKAAKVGFDWGDLAGPLRKVKEEFQEFEAELDPEQNPDQQSQEWDKLEDEFGDILFAMVNVGRFLKINAEMALERTNTKFVKRFKYIEEQAQAEGKELTKMTLAEMDELWEKAKLGE